LNLKEKEKMPIGHKEIIGNIQQKGGW